MVLSCLAKKLRFDKLHLISSINALYLVTGSQFSFLNRLLCTQCLYLELEEKDS